jgi:hypothetical protein
MSQYAYAARSAAGSASGVPTGPVTAWPFGWIYPGDQDSNPYAISPISGGNIPGLPWPPGWPVAALANTALVLSVPATISIAAPTVSVECYITVNGVQADASPYAHHLLQLSLTENGAGAQLKKTGAADYSNSICFQVTNYAGNKWGFNESIVCYPYGWVIGHSGVFTAKLITAVANVSQTANFTVIA